MNFRKISISWCCPFKSVYLYFNYVGRLADESGVRILPAHHVHRPHEPSCRPRHQEHILTFILYQKTKNLDCFAPPTQEDGRDHTATKNSTYVFLFWKLRGVSPNFHIRVSVSDLYIPRIVSHIFLQQNRQTDAKIEYHFRSFVKICLQKLCESCQKSCQKLS